MTKEKLRLLTLTAFIGALCAIGGAIKIPSFITTTALDSAPAFLSVYLLPPLYAGFAGLLGHIATAFSSGMPLGVFHILIALEMFGIVYLFHRLHTKKYRIGKWLFLLVANGVIAPLPFYWLISPAFFVAAIPGMVVATAINIAVVLVLLPALKPIAARMGWVQ